MKKNAKPFYFQGSKKHKFFYFVAYGYLFFLDCKVNSVQEAWAKCFGVHILEFEILQITWKMKQRTSDS